MTELLIPGPTRHRAQYLHDHSVRVLDGAEKQTVDSTAFITVLNHTVHGNELGPNGCIHIKIRGSYENASGSNKSIQLLVQFGGTTMYIDNSSIPSSASGRRALYVDILLFNKNSTSNQGLGGIWVLSNPGGAVTGVGNIDGANNDSDTSIDGDNPAADTTTDQNLFVRLHQISTDVGVTLTVKYVSAELFRGP